MLNPPPLQLSLMDSRGAMLNPPPRFTWVLLLGLLGVSCGWSTPYLLQVKKAARIVWVHCFRLVSGTATSSLGCSAAFLRCDRGTLAVIRTLVQDRWGALLSFVSGTATSSFGCSAELSWGACGDVILVKFGSAGVHCLRLQAAQLHIFAGRRCCSDAYTV